MSSSEYPTINYNVFIPSNWSSSSVGFTEAELNRKYLRFPTAQTTQAEIMRNITLTGQINTTTANPLVINSTSRNTFISSDLTSTVTSGVDNTSLGNASLSFLTSGNRNTAVGDESLNALTNQNDNTALGHRSLVIAGGAGNVAVGSRAGETLPSSSNNTLIGFRAGVSVGSSATAGNNTFLGASSGFNSGLANYSKSTAIGYEASITASSQVVLGTATESVYIPSGNIYTPASNINISSNKALTLGANNVAIGLASLQNADGNTNGNNAIGYGALQNSKANNNTALGFYALPTNTSGINNTAIGNSAGGINSGVGLTTGTNNTFLGANTNIVTGQEACNKSTAIGQGAIITASNQVVLGTSTETVVIPSGVINNTVTTGNYLFGSRAVSSWNIGTDNTILGIDALGSAGNSNNVGNTCVGRNAGLAILATSSGQGTNNTCVGRNAGDNITTGSSNTCIGANSANITTGTNNISINSTGITTGDNNICLGSSSGSAITSGDGNVCIGQNSGGGVTSNDNSTFIGNGATSSGNFGSSTAIGAGATVTASNQIMLGTSSQNTVVPSAQFIFPLRQFYGGATQINSDTTLTYPLNRVYAVRPSSSTATNVTITLPAIVGANEGTIVTFRMVGTGGVGQNVFINTTGGISNIFLGTSSSGVSSHTLYTASSSVIQTHTFIAMATNLGGNTNGWFQQGSA